MPDDLTRFDVSATSFNNTALPVLAAAPVSRWEVPAAPAVTRQKFIGFARDRGSANMLQEALSGHIPGQHHMHIVNFRASLEILKGMTTPEIVLVDLTGEDQPLNAIMDLSDVVEAGTLVIAVGEVQSLSFYRTITKGMGVKEYLPKPLSVARIERHLLPFIQAEASNTQTTRTGRIVSFAGTRGGVGTSAITANLAWFIASELHCHTVLLDTDLYTGSAALYLNVAIASGLNIALESPERLDPLLIERSVRQASGRLHVLAGQEDLNQTVTYQPGAAESLTKALAERYNFVIADTGARGVPIARDTQYFANQRVIVMDPSMISLRNAERLMELPGGPAQGGRIILVLNKAGMPNGLDQGVMEKALGQRFDAVIPDLPDILPRATEQGIPAAAQHGPFKALIGGLAKVLGATARTQAA